MTMTESPAADPTVDLTADQITDPLAGPLAGPITDPLAGPAGAALTELVVAVYREALGVADLDEQSDFYEWGGDSLTAFRVTARLEEALGVEVPVALVFAYPTPADLAGVVDADFVRA
ncbi:acyl carrier protein [Streptomyces sp. NPDC127106]|uniref:acyl carrier protein n=1 Tax=Streptomyces sp. NPDC127106 TaxID=3345360 RepID=UPI0036276F8A